MRLGILKQTARLRIDNESPAQKLLRLARLRHCENLRRINDAPLENSSRLIKTQRYRTFKKASESMAERLVRLSKKRSYEKGKRMSESLTERSERLYKKRKSQQLSREFKIPKYGMEAVSQQISEDNQSDCSLEESSFNRLQRELMSFGYSTSSNSVSVKQFLRSITEEPYLLYMYML